MAFLYRNAAHPPFDDVRVRKALSMGIDRPKIVDVAMYGYTPPADGTGLTDAYAAWRDPTLAARAWVTLDAAGPNRLLDEGGYPTGRVGVRRTDERRLFPLVVAVAHGWSRRR